MPLAVVNKNSLNFVQNRVVCVCGVTWPPSVGLGQQRHRRAARASVRKGTTIVGKKGKGKWMFSRFALWTLEEKTSNPWGWGCVSLQLQAELDT